MRRLFLLCLVLSVVLVLPAWAQGGFEVMSFAPERNAITIEPDADIIVTFSAAVNPATVEYGTYMVFGRWSGVVPMTASFEENGTRLRLTPNRPYLAGETVTVSLSKHVKGADGATMPHAFAWQFWTRTLPGTLDLKLTDKLEVRTPEEINNTPPIRVQTYGAYAGDLDADGYTDFIVPNELADDIRVFMNDRQGHFTDTTHYKLPRGDLPSTNEGSDFNLDGHLDFAVGSRGNDDVSVFMGDGTGLLFGPDSYDTARGVRGLAVLDMNGDGYMDIAIAARDDGKVALLHNQGDGTFTVEVLDESITNILGETAAATADINEDGLLDLFIGAHGNSSNDAEIAVLLGDGEGGFTHASKRWAGGRSWMVETGDVNGDGHVDVVTANSMSDNIAVLFGDGTGNISEPTIYETTPSGSSSWPFAIDLGDIDGDGDLDMVSSNYRGDSWDIFENLGDGTFGNRRTLAADNAGSCAVLHDRDNDGDLDMTGIDELTDRLFLFTNDDDNTAIETEAPSMQAALLPAFPNPFTSEATLGFRLDAPAAVHLAVYDVLGRRVRTLKQGLHAVGEHQARWDGHDEANQPVPAGLYFIRLETPTGLQTRTVVYLSPSP